MPAQHTRYIRNTGDFPQHLARSKVSRTCRGQGLHASSAPTPYTVWRGKEDQGLPNVQDMMVLPVLADAMGLGHLFTESGRRAWVALRGGRSHPVT